MRKTSNLITKYQCILCFFQKPTEPTTTTTTTTTEPKTTSSTTTTTTTTTTTVAPVSGNLKCYEIVVNHMKFPLLWWQQLTINYLALWMIQASNLFYRSLQLWLLYQRQLDRHQANQKLENTSGPRRIQHVFWPNLLPNWTSRTASVISKNIQLFRSTSELINPNDNGGIFYLEANKTEYFVYNLPGTPNATSAVKAAEGSCGNGTSDQYIVIEWTEAGQINQMNLTFHLNTTTSTKEFSLSEAVFNLSSNIVPNNNRSFTFYHVGSVFEIPKDRSYYCTRSQSLNLTDSAASKNTVGTVSVSHVLLEAYHSSSKADYSNSIDCDAINTPGNRI